MRRKEAARTGSSVGSKFYRLATQSRLLSVTWRDAEGSRRRSLSRINVRDFRHNLQQLTKLVGNLPHLEHVHVLMYFDAGDPLR